MSAPLSSPATTLQPRPLPAGERLDAVRGRLDKRRHGSVAASGCVHRAKKRDKSSTSLERSKLSHPRFI